MTDRTWIDAGNNRASHQSHRSPNGDLLLPGGHTHVAAGEILHDAWRLWRNIGEVVMPTRLNPSKFTLVTFDVPNATSTTLTGVNDKGAVVGSYSNGGGGFSGAFVDTKGLITTLFTGATSGSHATDINDRGQVVVEAGFRQYGVKTFVYDSQANVQSVSANYFMGQGINDRSEVVAGLGTLASGGILSLNSGEIHQITILGSVSMLPLDINNREQVVGTYTDQAHVTHGFLYADDKFKFINFPHAVDTRTEAINDRGVIVGEYEQPALTAVAHITVSSTTKAP